METPHKLTWTEIKSFKDARKIPFQYIETSDHYLVFARDYYLYMGAIIDKSEPRGSDQVDFEDNYKSDANVTMSDKDGRLITRNAFAQSGWTYCASGFEFSTSDLDSTISLGVDNQSDSWVVSYKLYDDQGAEITLEENEGNAVKTVVSFEPSEDYEIVAGRLLQATQPVTDVRMNVVAVPTIPKGSGGSKEFVKGLNLRYFPANEAIETNGRASKYLKYDATNHTSRLDFIFYHNTGLKHSIHILLDIYRA